MTDDWLDTLNRIEHNTRDTGRAVLLVGVLVIVVLIVLLSR